MPEQAFLQRVYSEIIERPLIFEKGYDDGNSFWLMERDYNALFRVTKRNFQVELIGSVPHERFMQKRLYPSMVLCQEKLYFAPNSAKEIAEYDLRKRSFRKIQIPLPRIYNRFSWEQAKFFGAETVGNKIYFIPDRYSGILCYDTETGVFFCFDGWVDEIEKRRSFECGYFVSYVRTGNQLVLPCICADAVVIFNLLTETAHVIKTSCTENGLKYVGIAHVEDYFYLLTADGAVFRRKLKADDEEVTQIPVLVQGEKEIAFYPMQYGAGYLYLLPFEENKGVKINIEEGWADWEPLLDRDKESRSALFPPNYFANGKLYVSVETGCSFIEYNFKENNKCKISWFSADSDQTSLKKHKEEEFGKLSREEYVTESDAYPLSYLLEKIARSNGRNEDDPDIRLDVGKRIYQSMRPV